MLSLREFWRRHKRKILVTTGVVGSGILLYRLYNAQKRSLAELERQLAEERENEELIKSQMQAHFENIQRIAETATLPHAMHYLSSRIAEELDLSHLTDRLMRGKGQPNTLTPVEKIDLWERLKILSFTRMVVSLWTVTMLSLYIRVQVNILGRHLYIDTARGLGSSHLLDNVDLIDREDQQKFLSSADFLANYGMLDLISNIQAAATEVLKGKHLGDVFNTAALHDTIIQIIDMFMSMGRPHQWLNYLMPEDTRFLELATGSSSNEVVVADTTKFDHLMGEARAVLYSAEYGRVAELSLRVLVDALVADMETQSSGGNLSSGMPLARLLPRVVQMGPSLLDEPSENRFIHIFRSIPEVEVFFTLLYANMPPAL